MTYMAMTIARGNMRLDPPDAEKEEVVQELLSLGGGVRVERIVSNGQASPPDFWYDQEWDEWVMIVSGGAEVEFSGPNAVERLSPDDWLFIPANRRHRVKSTRPGTIWLAVHAPRADGQKERGAR